MKVRPFEPRDRAALVALWRACGLVVPWNDPDKDIDRKRSFQPDLLLVAEEDGAIVATVMAGYEGHRGWINYLAVHPEHRRNGLGRRMMDEAEARLRALGCPKINLQVRKTNTHALGFYEAIGYKVDESVSLGKRLVEDNESV